MAINPQPIVNEIRDPIAMKVWVIMGNDFPDAVFDNEEAAEAHIKARKAEGKIHGGSYAKIYWRAYEFPLQSVTQLVTL